MRCEKDRRALICYAGSAPEASIGSKPIGSELKMFIWLIRSKSQHFVDWSKVCLASVIAVPSHQDIEDKYKKWSFVPCGRIGL